MNLDPMSLLNQMTLSPSSFLFYTQAEVLYYALCKYGVTPLIAKQMSLVFSDAAEKFGTFKSDNVFICLRDIVGREVSLQHESTYNNFNKIIEKINAVRAGRLVLLFLR